MATSAEMAKIRADLKKKREAELKYNANQVVPVSDMKGLGASAKASVLRKNSQGIRQDIKKYPLIPDDELSGRAFLQSGGERLYNMQAVRRQSAATDYDKAAARLESRGDRTAASSKYRLAKMKADKKMSKPSKTGKMLDDMEMKNAPRNPFITKKKGNK